MPKTRKYWSKNHQYVFKVEPRRILTQLAYFQDLVEGSEDPGSASGQKVVPCTDTLYRNRRLWSDKKIGSKPLSNDVAPVEAAVSSDGQYVVTFDNWHSVGYGDDDVVIFGPQGKLIRKFSWEDLLGHDAQNVTHSVSSRWWRGHVEEGPTEFDEKRGLILIEAVAVPTVSVGPLRATKSGVAPQKRLIAIRLATGEIVQDIS